MTSISLQETVLKKRPDHVAVTSALGKVRQIDFAPIRLKLSHPIHGEGMPHSEVINAQMLYEAYLALLIVFGTQYILAPPLPADKFWHYHILDTRKYMKDCQYLFGEFLHHYPYFGMRDEDDELKLKHAGKHTLELMASYFSEVEGFADILFVHDEPKVAVCIGSCARCKAVSENYISNHALFA